MIVEDPKELGAAIRLARRARGLSQVQLAEASGCSQRFVSELERGKRTAELGKALDVARVVGLRLVAEDVASQAAGKAAVDKMTAALELRLERQSNPTPRLSDYLGR